MISYRILELSVPSMFAVKTGKTGNYRGNQHSNNADVSTLSKAQAEKRIWGKLATARNKAPQDAKRKWDEICSRKGTRGGNIVGLKKEFLLAWVSDPEWTDSYFSQSLHFSEKTIKKRTGTWITVGRLQQLIGKQEAEVALAGRADTANAS